VAGLNKTAPSSVQGGICPVPLSHAERQKMYRERQPKESRVTLRDVVGRLDLIAGTLNKVVDLIQSESRVTLRDTQPDITGHATTTRKDETESHTVGKKNARQPKQPKLDLPWQPKTYHYDFARDERGHDKEWVDEEARWYLNKQPNLANGPHKNLDNGFLEWLRHADSYAPRQPHSNGSADHSGSITEAFRRALLAGHRNQRPDDHLC
jgi:hypothetical protein